jgi:predicted component of type VI protein secretion system
MSVEVSVMIMSGVEDGTLLSFQSNTEGDNENGHWTLTVGRRDENDLTLRNDTFVSRTHARLHWKDNHWWLEDVNSTNGTFIELIEDFFTDRRVKGIVPVDVGQLFRVGRTWMRIQTADTLADTTIEE